ncbi:MAG: hypothetical protein WDM76_19180 [Limisphaerales bacterium]
MAECRFSKFNSRKNKRFPRAHERNEDTFFGTVARVVASPLPMSSQARADSSADFSGGQVHVVKMWANCKVGLRNLFEFRDHAREGIEAKFELFNLRAEADAAVILVARGWRGGCRGSRRKTRRARRWTFSFRHSRKKFMPSSSGFGSLARFAQT